MEESKLLEYVSFSSCVNPSFWFKLTQLKIDVDKLSEEARLIWGYYSNLNSHTKLLFEVDSTSFNTDYNGLKSYLPYHGTLINKNTIEQFKQCNKVELINSIGKQLYGHIKTGSAIKDPSLLNIFFILSFADLKKYNFYYWFGFPVSANIKVGVLNISNISNEFDDAKLLKLTEGYNNLSINNKTFFLVKWKHDLEIKTLDSKINLNDRNNLSDFDEFMFGFSDASAMEEYAGWTLRNYIMFLLYHCPVLQRKTVKFIGYRLSRDGSQVTCKKSIILQVKLSEQDNIKESAWVGYESNERGKMGPRLSKMKESMSPVSLAETSVDLNLKLMKWQLLPDINLEKIKESKCLLLGAGTLGCSVARNLIGWGIRTITFVDNGTVSFSNPVRQSLYTYEDSIACKPKAAAAAECLKKIFPSINSTGYQFTIPMPDHPVGDSLLSQTKESVSQLTDLIQQHDIIFLLMDSRESRWLPTLLCATFGKVVINAALGFDTYLVMRHGARIELLNTINPPVVPEGFKIINGNNLGCYFCNDITAPGDSMKDRSLDQQCTVTRPGVSNIAGALAVELAVSILQHDNGIFAPALYASSKTTSDTDRENECVLGIIPHSIRGFLSLYSHVLPATERYNQCIACSDIITKEYRAKEFDFLLQIFNDSSYLEQLTGLNKIYDENELEVWDLSDEESI